MSLNLFAYGEEEADNPPKQVETTASNVKNTKVEKAEKEAVLKEKTVQIEKAVEVKAKEEKAEPTSSKLNIEKINKETSPLPKENESSNWTAVFDKNTGCYYYWNRKTNETTWTCPECFATTSLPVQQSVKRTAQEATRDSAPIHSHTADVVFGQPKLRNSKKRPESNIPLSRRGKQRWEGTGIDPLELGGKKRNNYRGWSYCFTHFVIICFLWKPVIH